MYTDIIEVTNSMSPQGELIGNASEVVPESKEHKENCIFSYMNDDSSDLTLSPTSPVPWSGVSLDDYELPSLAMDTSQEDKIMDGYSAKLNLTEIVMHSLVNADESLLEVFSAYDEEKDGLIEVTKMKNCLIKHNIILTDSEFHTVFDGFIVKDAVNYIQFLQSWNEFQLDSDIPIARKRSSSDDQCDGNKSPKRRPTLCAFTDKEKNRLRSEIRIFIVRQFGNTHMIFQKIGTNNKVYISELCTYLNEHQISCTINQLCILLAPFALNPSYVTFNEFTNFVNSLSTNEQMDECLVEAFPQTFGRTTHIDLLNAQDEETFNISKGMHRTTSVARNLNNLPLYQLMLNVEQTMIPSLDEDSVFI